MMKDTIERAYEEIKKKAARDFAESILIKLQTEEKEDVIKYLRDFVFDKPVQDS